MPPRHHILATICASGLLLTLMTGCAEKTETVPELPDRVCWDLFTRDDVEPLLPGGDKMVTYASEFPNLRERGSISCSLDIDGVTRFHLTAYAQDSTQEAERTWQQRRRPTAVDVGDKGITWNNGGASYFLCKSPGSDADSEDYIDVSLSTMSEPDVPRDLLLRLLRQYVDGVRAKLDCL